MTANIDMGYRNIKNVIALFLNLFGKFWKETQNNTKFSIKNKYHEILNTIIIAKIDMDYCNIKRIPNVVE